MRQVIMALAALLLAGCATAQKPSFDSIWDQIMEARNYERPEPFDCKPQHQEPISQEGVCL